MVPEIKGNFRVLNYEEVGQVKTKLVLESTADTMVEKRKLGFDRGGAPDLEIHRRSLKRGEQFVISVFNDNVPTIGCFVTSDYIVEQADVSFFSQASSFSGKPISSFGFGPWG